MIMISILVSLINLVLTISLLSVNETLGVVVGIGANAVAIIAFIGLFYWESKPMNTKRIEKILKSYNYKRTYELPNKF